VKEAIAQLKQKGVASRELATLQQMIYLEFRKNVDENRFWTNNMLAAHYLNKPLVTLFEVPKMLEGITTEQVKNTARQLFGEDLLLMVLLPKNGK